MLARPAAWRPLLAAIGGAAVVVAGLSAPAPAFAGVPAPGNLTPTGSTSSSTPTFGWSRVSGATYTLQVDDSSGFDSPLFSVDTANNQFVPTNNLGDGKIYYRVRAATGAGVSSWKTSSVTISPTAAPTPTSPINDVTLTQPDEPALLTWDNVPGAQSYQVQVDNTGSWVSPQSFTSPGGGAMSVSALQPGTWHWRVRADRGNGLYTQWSDGQQFEIAPLQDVQAGDDMNSGTPITDVSIDWKPVPGAAQYQLQVGRDPDFNNIVDDQVVDSTRFQPEITYGNDQYYWRVRAIDPAGHQMPWSTGAPFAFQRNWLEAPALLWPPNTLSPTEGDPSYFQWSPIKRASRYGLEIGSDPNFSPGTYNVCYTTGTTLPVDQATTCLPLGQGQTMYWRVRGFDDPAGIESLYSDVHRFIYSAGAVTLSSPANGATVQVPTLTWQPARGASSYQVTLVDKNGGTVSDFQTSALSWTPEASKLTAANSPYTWRVRSYNSNGGSSPVYPGRTFYVDDSSPLPTTGAPALTPLTGTSADPATSRFPSLTWEPMPGADHYTIQIGVHGSNFWDNSGTSHINGTSYVYPAATDTGAHYMASDSYDWRAIAYDNGGGVMGIGQTATFTIKDLDDVTGQQLALDGLADVAGTTCSKSLDNPDASQQICVGLPATPVLSWNPVPNASFYLVYLANDRELTNRIADVNPYRATATTMFRPPSDLPDNTAGTSYFWYVRPCKSVNYCNPDPIGKANAATNAFRKISPAVEMQAPADGSTQTDLVTFSWKDYLSTNQAQFYNGGARPSYQTARGYHLQIAQSPTFNNNTIVDERTVDQPFYTQSSRTLPQGILYWRVQAVDPSNNRLNWSATRSFDYEPTSVSLDPQSGGVPSPVGGVTVSGVPVFRWPSRLGAQHYTIEVYKNDDATYSPANLVISGDTQTPAYPSTAYLPPSSQAYRWRIRWVDADSHTRPWSNAGRFFVKAKGVTLTGPGANTLQKGNALYFSWSPVPTASRYVIDVRNDNGIFYSVNTAATAHAPSVIGDGSYQWRVKALDANSNVLGTSSWRGFHIDGTAPVVVKRSPDPTGSKKQNVVVVFNEKVKNVTTTSMVLHVQGRTTKVPAKVSLSSSGLKATLNPTDKLKSGKYYTVTLKGIKDKAGNKMAKYTWTFSVQ